MNGQDMHDEAQGFASGDRFKKSRGKVAGEQQKRKQKLEVKDQLESIKRSQRIASKSYSNKNVHTRGCSPTERLSPRSSADSLEDACRANDLSSPQDQAYEDQIHDVVIIHHDENNDGLQESQQGLSLMKEEDGQLQQQEEDVGLTTNLLDEEEEEVEQHQGTMQQEDTDELTDVVRQSFNVATGMTNSQMNLDQSNNNTVVGGGGGGEEHGMPDDKEYTQMKSCGISPQNQQQEEEEGDEDEEQQTQQQQDQQQVNQNIQQQQQQQQNQIYGNYGQGSMYQHHGGIGQVWYPHDATFGASSSTMQDPAIPTLHFPQPHVQSSVGVGNYRQPQYGMDTASNQAYGGYQQNQMVSGYGSSQSYLPQYALGANGQYYRAVQGNEGLRYEMIDNSNLMSYANTSTNSVLPHNYRSVMQNPGSMRVASPSSQSAYNPGGLMRGVEQEKDWGDEEDSEDELEKMKGSKNKKDRVKRPMNAFLVWSCQKRAILAKNNPGMSNADISVRLGERWKSMTPAQKQPFYDEAAKIKADHKTKHPEWTYQPKPKKRRLGQGTTWLYAITENTRGGRVSHYINSYNHYDGNLVLSSLNNQNGTTGGNPQQQQQQQQQQVAGGQNMLNMPVQSMQTTSPPPHHAMYMNPNMNHAVIGQRSNNLLSKYDALQQTNPSVYLQNQPNILLGASQNSQQPQHLLGGAQLQQQADSVNSLFAHTNLAGTYPQHQAQNLSMSNFGNPTTIPVSSLMPDGSGCSSSVEKYTTGLTDEEARKLMNFPPSSDPSKKDGGENEPSKSGQLSAFDDGTLPSLREFLHSDIIRGSESCGVGDAEDHNEGSGAAPGQLGI